MTRVRWAVAGAVLAATAACDDGGAGGDSARPEDCVVLAHFSGGMAGFGAGLIEPGAPIDYGAVLADLAGELQDARLEVPPAVEDDVELFAARLGQLAAELDGLVVNPADTSDLGPDEVAQVATLAETLRAPDLAAAADRLRRWGDQHCPAG